MPDSYMALESAHVARIENIGNEAVGFSQPELALKVSHNSSSILSTVLKNGESVIDQLVDMDIFTSNDSNDATHCIASTLSNA